MVTPILNFDHSHHKLKIRGLQSPVDVLTFEGHEQLSHPSATISSLPVPIKPSSRSRC